MWFSVLKWVHIMAAIIAVGANLTYGIWIRAAAREPAVLPFILNRISVIDRQLANPCYGVLLLSGLGMAWTARIPLTTPWLLTALVLYALSGVLGIAVYAPVARRGRQLLETQGFDSAAYRAAAQRGATLGTLVTLDVLVIVFLMVVKPALWG